MSACCASLRRSSASATPGKLESARLPALRSVVLLGDRLASRHVRVSPTSWRAAARPKHERIAELAPHLQFDEPINIQFTSGTTGFPKGATLSHHNILNNGFFIGEAMRLTPEDRLCIPVPLYHCFGMVLGNLAARHARRLHGVSRRGVRSAGHARNRRRGALHGAARRADHVHRAARSSGVRPLRSVVAAHRHHGGLAVPDRGDEARGRQDAPSRDHHRLRHDRDEPGELPELDRRSAGAPRLDGRPHPAASRSQDRRCARPHRAARARRANC